MRQAYTKASFSCHIYAFPSTEDEKQQEKGKEKGYFLHKILTSGKSI